MQRTKRYCVSPLASFLVIVVLACSPAFAQNFSVVYNFGIQLGQPANPTWSGIWAQGRNGDLYSTSAGGGLYQSGAIFEASPDGKLRVLYSFCAQTNCPDGFWPYGGLTLGLDGNFYGTTSNGGTFQDGTIFKVTPNGTFTQLHNFSQLIDGQNPDAPPIQAPDGTLYGTVKLGGPLLCGDVYQITTAGVFSILYPFDGTHGCNPFGPLVLGTDGNFYGTTSGGGYFSEGAVFRLSPAGQIAVLSDFPGGGFGNFPMAGLVEGSDGSFWGTTNLGGNANAGVIFRYNTAYDTMTVLYGLNGTTDGSNPTAGLVLATDGNFYGTSDDTIFQITPTGSYSVVYTFTGPTGDRPNATPIQHTNGLIYGDTAFGGSGEFCLDSHGTSGCGVIYSWNNSFPAFVTLLPYSGNVGDPVQILGQGFTSASTVSFNGVPASSVKVYSGTFLGAVVPGGATTGLVTVTTSSGPLSSNRQFIVRP